MATAAIWNISSAYLFSLSLDVYFRALIKYYHYETLLFFEILLLSDRILRVNLPLIGHNNAVEFGSLPLIDFLFATLRQRQQIEFLGSCKFLRVKAIVTSISTRSNCLE